MKLKVVYHDGKWEVRDGRASFASPPRRTPGSTRRHASQPR